MSAFELPFNEPYLSVLLNVPPPAAAAASPSRSGSPSALPSTGPPSPAAMADMISTVPPHITRFLVLSAPVLAWARKAAEVLLWRDAHSRAWSWAVVGAWWVACLGGPAMLRLLLPPAMLLVIVYPSLPTLHSLLPARLQRRRSLSPAVSTSPIAAKGPSPRLPTSSPSAPAHHLPPATTQSVQVAIANFSAVTTLVLQHWPPEWFLEVRDDVRLPGGWRRVARALAGVWALWLLGGLLLGLRVMLALVGTVVLLSPSPYVAPVQRAFGSSFFFTRLGLFLSLLILGPSFAPTAGDAQPANQSLLRWAWTRSRVTAQEASDRARRDGRGRSASMKALLGTIKRSLSRSSTATLSTAGVAGGQAVVVAQKEEEADEWDEEPVLFRFEVMENQRWWLALDWTGTLAPGDRPIWCDTHLHPTLPPPQFVLPPSHTITIPHPPNELFNEVRIATWRWAEDDWSVLRSVDHSNPKGPTFVPTKVASADGSGGSGASPLPAGASQKDINAVGAQAGAAAMSPGSRMSLGEQALSRGLERLKAATASASSSPPPAGHHASTNSTAASAGGLPSSGSSAPLSVPSPTRASGGSAARGSMDGGERKTLFAMSLGSTGSSAAAATGDGAHLYAEDEKEVEDLDALTDEAGWSYGGNKWEGMGPKGGLGKFTRRRRWVRLAVLEEHVHLFPKTYVLPQPPSAPTPPYLHDPAADDHDDLPSASLSTLVGSSVSGSAESSTTARTSDSGATADGAGGGGGGASEALRLRLKKAVEKGR